MFMDASNEATSLDPLYFTLYVAVRRRESGGLGVSGSIRIEKVNQLTLTIISVLMHRSRLNSEVKRAWTGAVPGWVTHREVLFYTLFVDFLHLFLIENSPCPFTFDIYGYW